MPTIWLMLLRGRVHAFLSAVQAGRYNQLPTKNIRARRDPPRFFGTHAARYHDTALIRSELEEAGFSRVVIETRAEQSCASSPRLPAVAYCQVTLLRNEIEARDAGKLESATDYVASAIADRHGRGEVAAKIQAHVIVAVV